MTIPLKVIDAIKAGRKVEWDDEEIHGRLIVQDLFYGMLTKHEFYILHYNGQIRKWADVTVTNEYTKISITDTEALALIEHVWTEELREKWAVVSIEHLQSCVSGWYVTLSDGIGGNLTESYHAPTLSEALLMALEGESK